MRRGAAVTWERPEEMNGWLSAGRSANAASQQQQQQRRRAQNDAQRCEELHSHLRRSSENISAEDLLSLIFLFFFFFFFVEVNLNSVRFSRVVSKVNYKVAH